jgi:hypothetical protein
MDNVEDIIRKRREEREAEEAKAVKQYQEKQKQGAVVPTPEHILQFFTYKHLPEPLAIVSQPFCQLAEAIVKNLPRNPERTAALRKLLEAKDAAVRAFISGSVPPAV